ncbi:MAG: tail protein X [Magnetospirillum sp.]|nr:tail protein X [Magnetospirillum sp.]
MRYRTRQGDRLDAICWRYYGRESAAEAVYEANPGLAGFGPILPAGLEIELPDLAEPVSAPTMVKLWD